MKVIKKAFQKAVEKKARTEGWKIAKNDKLIDYFKRMLCQRKHPA